MLKVAPRFHLDRTFKGPFRIKSLTTTNAVIELVTGDKGEPMNVSLQRLSKCSSWIDTSDPWLGHSGKLRRQRQILKNNTQKQVTPGQP